MMHAFASNILEPTPSSKVAYRYALFVGAIDADTVFFGDFKYSDSMEQLRYAIFWVLHWLWNEGIITVDNTSSEELVSWNIADFPLDC